MRVLVTGANGFIGSHLVRKLRQEHEVYILDLHRKAVEVSRPGGCVSQVHYMQEVHVASEIDAIYHLAAITGQAACRNDRQAAFDVNVCGTQRMLELALEKDAQFIYPATADCSLDNPYSFTKQLAEECCRHYWWLGMRLSMAVIYSVYGPGQKQGVIEAFAQQRKARQPLTVFGDGSQRRDFIHVNDVVDGLIRLLAVEGEFEFGCGRSYSIREVAELFEHPIEYRREAEIGLEETRADPAAAQHALGWRPTVSLEEYIRSL